MKLKSSSITIKALRWCARNPVELLGGLVVLLLTVVVFLQVFYRYALHSPLGWSEEFAMFLWQWVNYIGAAVAVRHARNYHIDLVTNRLPGNLRIGLEIMSSLIVFGVGYLFIHMGIKMTVLTSNQLYPTLQFPLAYAYVVFPISGALMIIYNVPIFIKQIRLLVSGVKS